MKKTLLIIILILASVLSLTACKDEEGEGGIDLPDIIDKDPKITGVEIIPENSLVGSGEEVEFKVEAIMDDDTKMDITSDMKFRGDTDKVKFEENKAKVGEDTITGQELIVIAEYIGDLEVNIDLYATLELFNSLEDTINKNGVINNPDDYDWWLTNSGI